MKLSDKITASRFFFGIFMVFSAYYKNIFIFILFYFTALISDILDGFVARKYEKESPYGGKFDILADNFIVVCLILSFYLIKKEIVLSYKWHIFALFGYFAIIQLVNLNLKGKFLFMRTYAANCAAILFPFVILGFMFFDAKYLAYAYIFLMYFSLTEKLLLSAFRFEAFSIFLVKRIRLKGFFILFFTIILSLVINLPILSDNKVCFGEDLCINVEIRNTPEGRQLGLMYKESLNEEEGMLFIFDTPNTGAFWMKNMAIPIDIIFISSDKKIVSISANAQPCNKPDNECELYFSSGEYLYVVETAANFSLRHNLGVGQGVKII